jgi:hypothetical protein
VVHVGDDQLHNGQIGTLLCRLELPTVLEPFRDQAVLFELTGLSAVRAKVEAAAVQFDKRLAAGPVPAILG